MATAEVLAYRPLPSFDRVHEGFSDSGLSSSSEISDLFMGNVYLGSNPHADFDLPSRYEFTYKEQIALITFVEQLIEMIMVLVNTIPNRNPDALTATSCFTENHIMNYRKVFNQENPQLYVLPPSILDHNLQRAANCLEEATKVRDRRLLVLPVYTNCTWGGIHIDRDHKALYFVKGSFFRQHMGDNGLDYHALVRQEMETVKRWLFEHGEGNFHIVDSDLASPSLITTPEQTDGYNCGAFLFYYTELAGKRLDREPSPGFLAASSPDRVFHEIHSRRDHMRLVLENITPQKVKTPPPSPSSSKEHSPR